MTEPLPVERFADLSAEIEVTGDKEKVLAREKVERDAWEATRAHWLKVMADEAERRRLKVSVRYRNVFVAKRKVHEARAKREALESGLEGVARPDVAHLDAAGAVLAASLTSTPEHVRAPSPPVVDVPIRHAPPVPSMVGAPSPPVVRTSPIPATAPTPLPPAPMASLPATAPPPHAPSPQAHPAQSPPVPPPAAVAPPPRRVWSTMITDGLPGAQPATPFRAAGAPGAAPPPAPPPPAPSAPSPPPPPVAATPATTASPPRDPKLAGTVTFDLDELLPPAAVGRVGTGTGPLPGPSKNKSALPFGDVPAPPLPVPPAPPPPEASDPGARATSSPRGRQPIPEHLQATSALDFSQMVQSITPFAVKPASSPPVPPPTGSSTGLPFGAPRPSETGRADPAPPVRQPPPASLSSTTFADPSTAAGPATPFTAKPSPPTAKLQLGPPRLSINVFASIAAEIAEAPADAASILRKYSMTQDDHLEETMRWEAEFERTPDTRLRYGGIVSRYRGYIAQRKRK